MPTIRTAKERIFIAFFIYSLIIFGFALTSFLLFKRIKRIDEDAQAVNMLYKSVQLTLRHAGAFLLFESVNERFYANRQSYMLDQYYQQKQHTLHLAGELLKTHKHQSLAIPIDNIKGVINDGKVFDSLFLKVVELTFYRGFKDHGLIGEMRKVIHKVENENIVDQNDILMLRRHEKDYLLRSDKEYIGKLYTLGWKIIDNLRANRKIPFSKREQIIKYLEEYLAIVRRIVKTNDQIGFRSGQSGLNKQLINLAYLIDENAKEIIQLVEERKSQAMNKIQAAVVAIVTISVVLLLLLSVAFQYVFE